MESFLLPIAGVCAAAGVFAFLRDRRPSIPSQAKIGSHYGGWALVTGASSGIGEKFAIALADEKFDGLVLVASPRSEAALSSLKHLLEKSHPNLEVRIALVDLCSFDGINSMLEELSGLKITCLINNAGFGLNGRMDKLDLKRQLDMISVNCNALFHLSHALVAQHRDRGTTTTPSMIIVNIGSLAGAVPAIPWQSVYSATKTFVASVSRAAAVEWKDLGVKVLLIEPGTIADTNFQATSRQPEHSGRISSTDLVSLVLNNMRYLDFSAFEVIPTLHDRLIAFASQVLPTNFILGLSKARGRKYTPTDLL